MYVGRFVVVGPEVGAYRVSSRSFPNRELTARDEALTVGPTEDAPETDNPYVSYNCLRVVETPTGETAAFGNGSHVDPIAEKLEVGYPARDALAESLLALDYEKDDYDTPRIAATIGDGGEALIGTVRTDACWSRPSTSRRWSRPTKWTRPSRSTSRRDCRAPPARSTTTSSNTRSVRPASPGPTTGSRRRSRTATENGGREPGHRARKTVVSYCGNASDGATPHSATEIAASRSSDQGRGPHAGDVGSGNLQIPRDCYCRA